MNSHPAHRAVAPLLLGMTTAGLALPAWAVDVPVQIPEPGTLSLLVGAAGAAVLLWRNRKK